MPTLHDIEKLFSTFVQQQMPSGQNMTPDPRQALLQQMADVISPESVHWWPPAIGWWLLAALLIISLSLIAYSITKRIKQQRYRKMAKRYVESLYRSEELSPQKRCVQLMLVLKRVFFTAYPYSRNHFAGIYGGDWFDILNNALAKPYPGIQNTEQFKTQLNDALYRDKNDAEKTENILRDLNTFAKHWIAKHPKIISAPAQSQLDNLGEAKNAEGVKDAKDQEVPNVPV